MVMLTSQGCGERCASESMAIGTVSTVWATIHPSFLHSANVCVLFLPGAAKCRVISVDRQSPVLKLLFEFRKQNR